MSIKNWSRFSLPILALFAFAGIAAAQTATVPHLTVNATVANAVRLDISSPVNGVTGTGPSTDFVVDLGNVNALGIGTPATGVTATVTPGAGAAGFAIYTTPIVLTPVFSGYGAGTANIALTIGGGTNDATAVEGDSNALATLAAARVVVASSLSDVANTRHVGFKVSKTEATGPRTAIFLYTITMQP
jgi:hypothetical protein